jgi:hypothetical protein
MHEYLMRNMFGPCCVGCWLATDLVRLAGPNPQADALRGTPLTLDPAKSEALRDAPGTETSFLSDDVGDPERN